jgi:hypothetical protein
VATAVGTTTGQVRGSGFANNDPLWIANFNGTAYPLPHGWSFYTFYQSAPSGIFPGDQDSFNGDASRLRALANG